MSGLLTSFNAGVSGLRASQIAINVASHNIANTDTKGYVRQHAVMVDSRYNLISVGGRNALNQVGLGTDVGCVRQVRDAFLDANYRLEVGRQSFYEMQYQTITEVEDLFGEMNGEQFQGVIEDMWRTLQELSKEPSSVVMRDLFTSSVDRFMERCGTVQEQLNEYQVHLNEEITTQVKQINKLAAQIDELNHQISKYEAGGFENANDLRDSRNRLLDELGSYIRIETREMMNGMVTVTAESMPLVVEDRHFTMGVEEIVWSDQEAQKNRMKLLKPVWQGNGGGDVFDSLDLSFDMDKNTDVGSLRGLLTARGTGVANYTDIPVEPTVEEYTDEGGTFDETGYLVAMLEFEDARRHFNQSVDPSSLMTVQAQFDRLVHGVVTLFNDAVCPNKEIEINDNGVLKKIWVLDEENAPIASDGIGTMGVEIFSRRGMERYTTETVTIVEGGVERTATVRRYNEEDPLDVASLYTVRELEVNPRLMKNSNLIPIMMNPSAGDTGGYIQDIINGIGEAFDVEFATLDPNTLSTYTFKDYYAAMIADIGTRGSLAKGTAENQTEVVRTIEDRRQQLIGVSADEEMVDLIRFQHAYNASSRYITVIDEMLEHLLTRM